MASLRARVHKLPDPTHFFLLEVALILFLRSYRPDFLRTWFARLTLAPPLVLSVLTAAIWRRPAAINTNTNDSNIPAGVVPNAAALVRRGQALRRRDVEVARSENEVRKGQLRLEMLRKEIESRLPNSSNNNNNTSNGIVSSSAAATRMNSLPQVSRETSLNAFGVGIGSRTMPVNIHKVVNSNNNINMEHNTVDGIRAQI